MEKSLPLRGGFRRETHDRQAIEERTGESDSVDHLALGDGRMNVDAFDGDDRQVCREGFDVDFSLPASVQGVRDLGPELLEVNMVHPVADFLIASKADPDRAVRNLRMRL